MTILFNTARSRYPDVTGDSSGEFAAQAKQTIARALTALGSRVFNNSFIEDGTKKVPGTSFAGSQISDVVAPSKRKIITQDIQPTVIVKKRMFSTLRDSFDLKYMDEKERLYVRSVKTLFRKKCEEIAFHESLVFVDKIIEDPGFLNGTAGLGNLFNAVYGFANIALSLSAIDDLSVDAPLRDLAGNLVADLSSSPIVQQLFKIKEASEHAKQNRFTTWITDPRAKDLSATGPGVGVMEFTMMTDVTTRNGLSTGSGTCNITLQDPYRLSMITEADLDRAVKEAYLEDGRIPSYISERSKQIMNTAMQLDSELNESRRQRNVSEVNFDFPFGTATSVSATLVRLNIPFTESDLAVNAPQRTIIEIQAGRGFNSGSGAPVTNIPDEELFTATEQIRVKQIFELLREYKVIQDRAIDEFQLLNNQNNDIRDRLRQEFIGHNVVQHMDSIHVFANSFTRDESPVYDSSLGKIATDISSSFLSIDDVKAKISDEIIDQERQKLAPDMPLLIYKMIRNQHEFRGTGPQIWQGVVTKVSSSYESGRGAYTIQISAQDNTYFLNMSRINTQPGLTQIQGSLEDPLTPLDIKTNEATGLVSSVDFLPENKERIAHGIIKIHDYPNLGKTVHDGAETVFDTSNSNVNNILSYRHMNGLLYRWKRGILTATQNINVNRPLHESYSTPDDIISDYGQTIVKDVFAKLDSADIISVLVCGQPYNYNTFIRAALEAGSLTLDSEGGGNAYFNYLFDIFETTNPVNGKFLPAKESVVNRETVTKAAAIERSLTRSIGATNALERKLAQLIDQAADLKTSDSSPVIKEQLKKIQAEQDSIKRSIAKLNSTVSNVGDVRVFGDTVSTHLDDQDNKELSKQLKYTLLKKPEDVRYNQDKNYLIISDRYETDLTIQSYVQDLKDTNGFDPFRNTYRTPLEIASEVANTLKFELFADSQGNIVFRPPEYNKIPLSLLIKLIQLSQTDGTSLVPPFIESMVKNRTDTYKDRLLKIELEIRERVALLGGISKVNNLAPGGGAFGSGINFVTATETLSNGLSTYILDDIAIKLEAEAHSSFTEEGQQAVALSEDAFNPDKVSALSEKEVIYEVMSIRNALRELVGFPTDKYEPSSAQQISEITEELRKYTNKNKNAASERLRLTNELSTKISQRQVLVSAIAKLMDDSNSISDAASTGGPTALFGAFSAALVQGSSFVDGETEYNIIPKFLQGMVENDLQNYTGHNSGKRFIIEDDVILQMNFDVEAPAITRLDVYGSENLLGSGENIVSGVPLAYWAGASDFDMWRQFGYRTGAPETVPYLTNPETQLAPYAVFRLLKERGRIHNGSITIIGNEHYQVGETVYVAPKEMLYYIEEVNHRIDLSNNSFVTTLSLSYGRPLGQYIPQPFDLIGRTMLAGSKNNGLDMRVNRLPPVSSQIQILETVHFSSDIRQAPAFDIEGEFTQEFIKINAGRIVNAITKANSMLSKNDASEIELRGYTMSSMDPNGGRATDGKPVITPYSSVIKKYMEITKDLMVTGIFPETTIPFSDGLEYQISLNPNLGSGSFTNQRVEAKHFKSDPGIVVEIDKEMTPEDIKFRRMPSQQAWLNGTQASDGAIVGLPINSIDIVLIVGKNKKGDVDAENKTGSHQSPAPPSTEPATSTNAAPDADIGHQ